MTADDSYQDFRQGASLTLSTPITRNMRVFTTIRDETVQATYIPLQDGADQASTSLGSRETRSVTLGLTRDTRRYRTSLFDPIGGGEDLISFEHSGGLLGGRNAFRKFTVESSRFYPSFWKFILALHLRASYLQDRSGVNPIYLFYERFWLGGIDTVRGYPDYSILPYQAGTKRIKEVDLPVPPTIGGNKMFYLNAEYRFPIHSMVRGLVFLDAGQVWNEGTPNPLKAFDPMVSVGIGVRLEIVAGFLLRLEWGVPLRALPVYNTSTGTIERRSFGPRLHFSMGPSF
ncbi:MAG: hypothetical protein KatS3mg115_1325 [Candidatus Poribacteria bacterium]|nr:MAG: hypothetical protein KatS3mg115_1325 [Candidatus Poribacteria bacterium]